jgi:uncharacterized protein (DUF2225 family)
LAFYKCQCPCGCNYETNHKEQIHRHHIYAKSKGGSNDNYNLIYLCPNCHFSHIYSGVQNHKIKDEHTFELIRILNSTKGRCVEFKDFTGNIDYKFIEK